jgi:MFS family permease
MGTEASHSRWWIVVVSASALVVGQGPISVFAAGVFLKPVAQELGFGRGDISTAIAVANIMIAIGAPFFGASLDVYGVRRPLLLSIVLFALSTAAMALLTPAFVVLLALYGLAGLLGVGQNPTAYSKVIASYFDRDRGLAMGLALAGVGLGTALMPALSNALIANFGWRMGYVGLGAVIIVLAFLPVATLLPEPAGKKAEAVLPADLPGVPFAEGIRSWSFWALSIGFFLASTTINGTLVHVVPLLTDRGIAPGVAVSMISGAGLALIVGRVFAGYVMDRVFAPYVALVFLGGPLFGIAILAWAPPSVSPLVATILLGLGIGAETDLMSFLVTRYLGIRAFGALHGLMFSIFVLGNAAGAAAMGWSFQLLHSYGPAFAVFEVLLIIGCILFVTLGPYRYPAAGAR